MKDQSLNEKADSSSQDRGVAFYVLSTIYLSLKVLNRQQPKQVKKHI